MNKNRNYQPNKNKNRNHQPNKNKIDSHFLFIYESKDIENSKKTIDDFYDMVESDFEAEIHVYVCDSMMPYFKNKFKDYNAIIVNSEINLLTRLQSE